ncbi:DUF4440 domain-containing protein [Aquimarina sp. D1M17]|uniref:DUF4440 domain-containing protein n=1 Tax=Aquimarina acroporae TaxID=2937283 RepID=UPI0020C05C10|nr:DUF4440 domain-containing protein [Aquimarina acroporae]MCK8524032.1 DUF4440 domain-containing protein [Aquimarina acroporae]
MNHFKNVVLFFILSIVFTKDIAAQKAALHDKINEDMYKNFSQAYANSDYELFASIHNSDMLRISGNGGEIKSVDQYLEGYKKRWSTPSKNSIKIEFRLFERILSDTIVSDRGIYKVTYISDKNETQYSYGKFHVLLRLEDEQWKILMDYDSNENKTVTEETFLAAYALKAYEKYCPQ